MVLFHDSLWYQHLEDISSIFSRNFKAFATEFPKIFEEMFDLDYMYMIYHYMSIIIFSTHAMFFSEHFSEHCPLLQNKKVICSWLINYNLLVVVN